MSVKPMAELTAIGTALLAGGDIELQNEDEAIRYYHPEVDMSLYRDVLRRQLHVRRDGDRHPGLDPGSILIEAIANRFRLGGRNDGVYIVYLKTTKPSTATAPTELTITGLISISAMTSLNSKASADSFTILSINACRSDAA